MASLKRTPLTVGRSLRKGKDRIGNFSWIGQGRRDKRAGKCGKREIQRNLEIQSVR